MLREVDQSHSFVDDVPPYARAEKRGTSISGKELWIPQSNMDLHIEYPVPTVLELAVMWSDYMEGDTSSLTTADGVYGVFAQPVRDITGFASIDLCEVVRQTHVGLHMIERDDPDAITDYHKYTPDHAIRDDLTPAAQVLINAGLIPPVENIHAIRTIMRRWKQNGIYTFANTSTLPGCEPGTVRFLKTFLDGCFDGILFPRNHHGSLPLTKGVAAKLLIETVCQGAACSPRRAIHIDDSPHHNISFRNELQQSGLETAAFAPQYPTTLLYDHNHMTVTDTPLSAFQLADDFLTKEIK